MEEILKQVAPALIKSSPWLFGGVAAAILIVKMVLKHLKEQEEKKATALKERDEKRDTLFKETLDSREKFFKDELIKKDEIIEEYREEVKILNLQVVTLFKEDIEVRKNNNVLMDHLSSLLKVALNK